MEEEKRRASKKSTQLLRARTRSKTANGASPVLDKSKTPTAGASAGAEEGVNQTPEVVILPLEDACRKRKSDTTGELDCGDLKRTRMDEEMKTFMAEMRRKFDEMPTRDQFDGWGVKIDNNRSDIDKNKERIDANSKHILSMQASIERIEQDQIEARRGLLGQIERAVGGRTVGVDRREEEFNRARRSIRVWPIEGNGIEERREATASFLTGALGLKADQVGDFKIKMPRDDEQLGYNSPIFSEVIVEFDNQNIRDLVAARGVRLKDYIDKEKRPTCGIRIEVPEHLLPTFRVLNRYGNSLKRRVSSTFKKHVKFDDYGRNLFLQIKVGSDEWLNVAPDEANKALKRNDQRRGDKINSIFSPGKNGNSFREVRSASMSTVEDVFRTPTRSPKPMDTEKPRWEPPVRPKT